jgi:hypothetical protein
MKHASNVKRLSTFEGRIANYDLGDRLAALARKADLLAWALQGIMAEDNEGMWPMQDVAFEIKRGIEAIVEEIGHDRR